MMSAFTFSAGKIGSATDGQNVGGKRARTLEMVDVGGSDPDEPPPPLPTIPISFKDKVSGDFGLVDEQTNIGEDDFVIIQGAYPSIQFSDKVKNALYRPWRTAVIIKLMGRPLAFTFLRTRLLQKWDLKGPISLFDLENNYFIVKFLYEEDMKYVLTGGPWQIAGQYIVTQKWKPGFNAKEEKITHMTAWVRINGLNVEYFRSDVLEHIGSLSGTTVKVDSHTMSQARGKFARICVELDLAKPLTPFIEVEGCTFGVVYEGINLVCFECGCYGHGRDNCPVIPQAKQKVAESTNTENVEANTSDKVNEVNMDICEDKVIEKPPKMHGEWMLCKPRNTKKKSLNTSEKTAEISLRNSKESSPKKVNNPNGSRFNVLNEENNNEEEMVIVTPAKRNGKEVALLPDNSKAKAKTAGKKTQNSSPWFFKRALKDITNVAIPGTGGGLNKTGPEIRRPWKSKLGTKTVNPTVVEAVGLQTSGADVQNDVQGIFSFNVGGPFSTTTALCEDGLCGHTPPEISLTSDMSNANVDLDQQGDGTTHNESEVGLDTGMSITHEKHTAIEAGNLQN